VCVCATYIVNIYIYKPNLAINTATHYSALEYTAKHCITLQHTAAH